MNRRLMVPFLALLLMVSFIPRPVAQAYPEAVDSYGTSNQDAGISTSDHHPSDSAGRSALGQSFAVGAATYRLNTVQFYMMKLGNPTGTAYVRIYAHAGVYGASSLPNGAALASSDGFNVATLTGAYQLITFTFSGANQILLNPATNYVVVFENPAAGTIDGANYPIIGYDNSAPTHGGNRVEYANGAWAFDAADDVVFFVYGWDTAGNLFVVNNPVYENNTDAGTVEIHVTGDGFDEEYDISAETFLYFPVMPIAFSWPVYSATRYIYTPEEENFTVTVPYDTIGVYSMTVKDRTATGSSTTAYLEAWRSIGGSEILVERMKIIFGNPTPLNMMVGSVYHIKVLFEDGSEFDWGYFTATSTTSVTIIIREVEFGDGAQMLYGSIHVDGNRDGATITVDYLDDQNNTVWSNVTIRERSGPIVLEVPYSNSSYTMNWASANTTLAYIVTVEGQHTEFGAWGRSWTFDPTYSFPAFPSLTGIFGSASSDLLPFLLVAVVMIMFGLKWQAKGLLAGCLVASFLSLFGAASWSYYWLAFAWFIAIMVNINVGGEG